MLLGPLGQRHAKAVIRPIQGGVGGLPLVRPPRREIGGEGLDRTDGYRVGVRHDAGQPRLYLIGRRAPARLDAPPTPAILPVKVREDTREVTSDVNIVLAGLRRRGVFSASEHDIRGRDRPPQSVLGVPQQAIEVQCHEKAPGRWRPTPVSPTSRPARSRAGGTTGASHLPARCLAPPHRAPVPRAGAPTAQPPPTARARRAAGPRAPHTTIADAPPAAPYPPAP